MIRLLTQTELQCGTYINFEELKQRIRSTKADEQAWEDYLEVLMS